MEHNLFPLELQQFNDTIHCCQMNRCCLEHLLLSNKSSTSLWEQTVPFALLFLSFIYVRQRIWKTHKRKGKAFNLTVRYVACQLIIQNALLNRTTSIIQFTYGSFCVMKIKYIMCIALAQLCVLVGPVMCEGWPSYVWVLTFYSHVETLASPNYLTDRRCLGQ